MTSSTGILPQRVAMECARAVPSRPLRRMVVILLLWTCFCYLIFRATSRDDLISAATTGLGFSSGSSGSSGPSSSFGGLSAPTGEVAMHARELLQKETRRPNNVTGYETGLASLLLGTSTTEGPPGGGPVNYFEAEPAIDKSPKKEEVDVVRELADQLPNLPLVYLHANKGKNWHLQKANKTSCAKFPTLWDLHINNLYWQETETTNGTFYLYGAYLDRRKNNRLGPTIRILGMINRLEPRVKTFCQIWFQGSGQPVISKVLEYKYIWFRKWGNYKHGIFQPYMLACQLPQSHWKQVPISVSVVENECDLATNNLRVTYNRLKDGEKKKKFAVCVKGLDFPSEDISVRLVEWIEMLNILGADKVFLYNLEVHPNVTKVLEDFVRQGKVDLTPISLPGYQPNVQVLQHLFLIAKRNHKRQNELIPYNDCLYRNMYRYEYIALLDIDEVIMPLERNNWAEMMEDVVAASLKVKNESRASYNFRNVYFMDEMLKANEPAGFFKDIPPYLHMLQHVYRSANYTKPGQYVKCFHNPEKVLILHNHFPLGCLGGVCTSNPVNTTMAQLQHYRADCVGALKKSCEKEYKAVSMRDDNIWRFRHQLVSRTTDTLNRLGFFQNYRARTARP